VRLAYSPPYHATYNPVERCWGILELPWHGGVRDSLEAVVADTAAMTGNGVHPAVAVVTTPYQTGVRRTKAAMAEVETHLDRLPHLGTWFVDILYQPPAHVGA
jgi:Rhodopirellula transposase DDE domain